jgi:hypothetical protein
MEHWSSCALQRHRQSFRSRVTAAVLAAGNRPLECGLVSPPIGEPLAFHAFEGGGARGVVNANGDALIVAELKFREIAVQVLLGAMLIDALHAAPEDAESALDRVGMDFVADYSPAECVGYSITSSAAASSLSGTVSPSAFAVVRLIASSNLVDRSTGRSVGLTPLSRRPVWSPARR